MARARTHFAPGLSRFPVRGVLLRATWTPLVPVSLRGPGATAAQSGPQCNPVRRPPHRWRRPRSGAGASLAMHDQDANHLQPHDAASGGAADLDRRRGSEVS
jgi:hypothetical protein